MKTRFGERLTYRERYIRRQQSRGAPVPLRPFRPEYSEAFTCQVCWEPYWHRWWHKFWMLHDPVVQEKDLRSVQPLSEEEWKQLR